jgi:hypothetical protein
MNPYLEILETLVITVLVVIGLYGTYQFILAVRDDIKTTLETKNEDSNKNRSPRL